MRAGTRRIAHSSTGEATIIHSSARRYHSGDDIQPPSHCEPWGSTIGTTHQMRLHQGTPRRHRMHEVVGDCHGSERHCGEKPQGQDNAARVTSVAT